jgi:hypothetical protein
VHCSRHLRIRSYLVRSVRTESEGAFIPHLSLTAGIYLAFGKPVTARPHHKPQGGAVLLRVGHRDGSAPEVVRRRLRLGFGLCVSRRIADRTSSLTGSPCRHLMRVDMGRRRPPAAEGAGDVIREAPGPTRDGSRDLAFTVRHLVEVAARALCPGINRSPTPADRNPEGRRRLLRRCTGFMPRSSMANRAGDKTLNVAAEHTVPSLLSGTSPNDVIYPS